MENQTPRSGAEWIENIANLEPRALADIKFAGHDSANNPGDTKWTNLGGGRTGYDGKKGVHSGNIQRKAGLSEIFEEYVMRSRRKEIEGKSGCR